MEEMHAGHIGEVSRLARTQSAGVKELHSHRHTRLTLELALGDV